MSLKDGSLDSNNSDHKSSQEKYIPYSKKHNIKNQILADYCDYLEREIGVDPLFQITKTKPIDDFTRSQFEIESFFISSEMISIVYMKGRLTGYGPNEIVLFDGMLSDVFFASYRSIVPKVRDMQNTI